MKTKTFLKTTIIILINFIINATFYLMVLISPLIAYGYRNKTPITIFGANLSMVISGSMMNSGFNIGDVLVLKRINPKNIKVGDAIVFYYEASETPNRNELTTYVSTQTFSNKLSFNEMFALNNKYFMEAGKTNHFLCFHQVVNIYIDKNGELWFETWGTSNIDNKGNKCYDSNLTNENYVVAKYERRAYIAQALTKIALIFGFKTTIIIALSILLIGYIIRITTLLRKAYLVNKLLKRELSISNKAFTPKFFLSVSFKDKARLLSTAKGNELLIYKNKMFNKKYIDLYRNYT